MQASSKAYFLKTYLWMLNQIYPSYCLVCKTLLNSSQAVCDTCSHEIELISPTDRCGLCFSPKISCSSRCTYCQQHPPHHRLFGQACCLHESPATDAILNHMNTHVHWHLEIAMASLAYIQHHELRWPKPDLLVLEPNHWIMPNRRFLTLSKRIAKQLASLFHIPILSTSLEPCSLVAPELSLEEQYWQECGQASIFPKKPLHGANILTFSLMTKKGTTWKAFLQAVEPHGLAHVWNLGLIAGKGSWMESV